MRFSTLGACILVTVSFPAAAQDDLTFLPDRPDGSSPRAMLSTYLNAEVMKALEARRAAVAALKTPEDVALRQQTLKARFIEALGGFPERTPLNPRVVGATTGEGYRLERVIYESRPDHHVTGLFYLPQGVGAPPFPAVLIPCGHDANGKAAASYQRACILLARNGIASLCYDPISQGERRQLVDRDGRPTGAGGTTEHSQIGVGALLIGRSTANYRVWDGIRSFDYLASRSEIDASRLGCTGCSGGGTLTSYLMALDPRVAAAAPSCYITSLERLFATIGPQDAEQNITGQVAFGMDHADYLALRATRPTLLLASTRDFFDIQGTWNTFREAKQLYTLLGHPERVDMIEENATHGYPRAHREAMMRWMRRWLLGKDDAPSEGAVSVAGDAELQCTKTGQVLGDLHGKSVFDLNAEREAQLAPARAEFLRTHGKTEWLAEIGRLIALRASIAPARRHERGTIQRPGYTARRLVFTTEPGIEVPALLCLAEKTGATPPVVVVGEDLAEALKPGGLGEFWTGKGSAVLVADLRGMGTTAPASKRGASGSDVKEAYLSLHLARPLLGQRVGDLLAIIAALDELYHAPFPLIGKGTAGPIALHAAVLDSRISSLTLDHSLSSWSEVVRTPLVRGQLASVVPGALATYDLPDLATALAPRSLSIQDAVDSVGRVLSQDEMAATYAPCTRAYRALDAASRLNLAASGAATP
jgi:cephalosporin-C deacetylase-like acetyl esterase